MQKILFISAVLLASALALNPANCPIFGCLGTGQNCGAPCGTCFTDLGTCATAAFGNQNASCACLTAAVNCITPRADAAICKVGLKGYTVAYGNCTVLAGDTCMACPTVMAYPNPPAINTAYQCNPLSDYCNENKVCATKKAPGAVCNGTAVTGECAYTANPATAYACKAGTCQRVSVSYANDLCTVTGDCFTGLNCTAGICVGRPNATACIGSAQCDPGLYCATGICTPFLKTGDTCSAIAPDACGPAGVCTFEGKCGTPYTKAVGAPCTAFGIECSFGNYCPFIVGGLSNCTAIPAVKACYNDTDCTQNGFGSTCLCSDPTKTNGNGVCSQTASNAGLAACTTQATTLLTCTMTNNCRVNPAYDSFTCVGTKCKAEYNAYVTCGGFLQSPYTALCANTFTSAPTSANGSNGSNGGSGTKPNSASTLAVGVAVAALTAALL